MIREVYDEPRTKALYRVLVKYLSADDALVSVHNAVAPLLLEEQMFAEGSGLDPEITPEQTIRDSLKIHEHRGFTIPPGMLDEAVRAWKETPCVPRSRSSRSS